jgi:tetratricopeptide (TPR) repeat protein
MAKKLSQTKINLSLRAKVYLKKRLQLGLTALLWLLGPTTTQTSNALSAISKNSANSQDSQNSDAMSSNADPHDDCQNLKSKQENDYWKTMTCYFQQNEFEKAAQTGELLLSKHPNNLQAYTLTSWFYWKTSNKLSGSQESDLIEKALQLLNQMVAQFPQSWQAYVERSDYYYLRLKRLDLAYADLIKARDLYHLAEAESRSQEATVGQKASIENRIARISENLGRTGEAVEASCRALYFDPDDPSALDRIKRLAGSCLRKKVQDPRQK